MSYRRKFLVEELKYRPRKKFSHRKVVNKLADVVSRADNEISILKKERTAFMLAGISIGASVTFLLYTLGMSNV